VTIWTRSPEAARLLASCAADPPPLRSFACRFQEIEQRFVGRRVRSLRRIYLAAEPPIDTFAWRRWLALDPQRAILEAVLRKTATGPGPPRRPRPAIAPPATCMATLSTATAG
jgi:hypothetical protein